MALKPITSLKSLLSEVGPPDRLTLIERLGFGGQAEVWLARDQMLERFVTVKRVRAFKTSEAGDEDQRLNSLRARAEMEHPAIPTLFGVIPHGEQSWLVSEYVEGVALSELLGELSPESIYAIARDLLSALRCLERLSLVHGDLSPNNIVIDRNGQVRLLDFESCSRIGEELSSTSTIGFSAPERHARKVGLPTVDTWSVGAILIWLVTQRTPEIVFDDAKRPISVMIGPAIPATDVLGDVVNIAAAATRVDPSLRPSTADLEERLSLSCRWLEPVNRSALELLVRSRLQWANKSEEPPASQTGSAYSSDVNNKSTADSKRNGYSDQEAPRKKDQEVFNSTRGSGRFREQSGTGSSGSGGSNTRWVDAKWSDGGPFGGGWRGDRYPGQSGVRRWVKRRVKRSVNIVSARFPPLFFLSLGLASTMGLLVSVINWDQQSYSVRVDTTRLSPATALPNEFSPQWVASIFSSAMSDNWEPISEVEMSQKELSAIRRPGGDQVDADLLVRGQTGGIGVSDDSLKIEASANTQTHVANDAVTEVMIIINCAQGICELLAEHAEDGRSVLNHTVILDTRDARIWRAAIANLAQSITAG